MLYEQQLQNADYAALSTRHNISIFGTIDDHDYGCNNADSTFPHKQESALAFVDFLGLPSDSAMRLRAQAGMGVYGVQLYDFDRPKSQHLVPEQEAGIDPDIENKNGNAEPPSYSNHTVAVFVLDIRSHKDPWKTGSAAYQPDYQGDFLGEAQWTWFEQALANSRAAVHVVVNGVQVHAERFPNANVAEAWGKFPVAQQRLYDALLNHETAVPILISGDVHMSQLMRRDCVHKDDLVVSSSETTTTTTTAPKRHKRQRSLMELTTSGMTHSWGTMSSPGRSAIDEDNDHGIFHRFETFLTRNTMRAMHYFCPWTDIMIKEEEESADGPLSPAPKLEYSLEKNFGELEFDWDRQAVTLRTIGEQRSSSSLSPPILLEKKIHLDELRFLAGGGGGLQHDSAHEPFPARGSLLTMKDFVDEAQARQRANKVAHDNREWICVNHRGRQSENQVRHFIGHLSTGVVMTTLMSTIALLPLFLLMALIRRMTVAMSPRLHSTASSKTLRSIPMHRRSFP
jgi:PhoD-like phosphatase